MLRRNFLRTIGLAGAGTLALAFARRARADMVAPREMEPQVLAGVSQGAAPIPGTTLDRRPDGSRDFVKLGADLGAHAPHVFSADNANAGFHVWTMIQPVPKDAWAYLVGDDELRMASSIGQDEVGHTAVFDVDAAAATRIASRWGVMPTIRLPLDGGLTYEWSGPGGAVRGQPVRIRLRVTNHGEHTVRFAIGGRNEGPRDNRFSFRVRKDGREVALKDGPDFGGKELHAPLAPGAHVDVEADLRAWIDTPGVYDVDCAYAGELFGDTDTAGQWPEHAAETWDIAPAGTLRVMVV